MGGLLDRLSKSGLDYGTPTDAPSGAATPKRGDRVKYYDSPDAALAGGNQALAQVPAPGMQVTPAPAPTFTPTTEPMPPGVAGPEQLGAPTMSGGGPGVQLTGGQPAAPLPTVVKPTFAEASTDANGMPVANTPGLTRMGKLMQVLGLAAKGAMAGQAASVEAVARSGGHTSPGIGPGFMAGLQEPARELAVRQSVEHGGLENQAERQKIAMFPWMMRKQQADLAHTQASTDYMKAHAQYMQSAMAKKDQDTLQQLHASAVQKAISEGRDPQEDPEVASYADAITSLQRPPAPKADPHDELSIWRLENPNKPITEYWKQRQKLHPGAAGNEYRDFAAQNPGSTVEDFWNARNATPKSATRGQEAAAIVREKANYRKLEAQYKFVPETGEYEDRKTADRISAEEFTKKKQDIKDSNEEETAALTGNRPEHVEIPVSDAQGKTGKPAINPASPVAPKGAAAKDKQQMINVQIPGQPPGQIPAASLDAFKRKYPNASVTQ